MKPGNLKLAFSISMLKGNNVKDLSHIGDPCRYCNVPHDKVDPGPCPSLWNKAISFYLVSYKDNCLIIQYRRTGIRYAFYDVSEKVYRELMDATYEKQLAVFEQNISKQRYCRLED